MVISMQSTIGKWGDSEAVRIPKSVLNSAGLRNGDPVVISASSGKIVISSGDTHRRVLIDRNVSFEELFAKYHGNAQVAREDQKAGGDPWPDNALLGAEKDAWNL